MSKLFLLKSIFLKNNKQLLLLKFSRGHILSSRNSSNNVLPYVSQILYSKVYTFIFFLFFVFLFTKRYVHQKQETRKTYIFDFWFLMFSRNQKNKIFLIFLIFWKIKKTQKSKKSFFFWFLMHITLGKMTKTHQKSKKYFFDFWFLST